MIRNTALSFRFVMSALGQGVPALGRTIAAMLLSLSAWAGLFVFMDGMGGGPGTSLHELPVFVASWVAMLTAMMLPSELNYIAAFATLLKVQEKASAERVRSMWCFLSGYGIAWLSYGLAAYLLDLAIRALSPEVVAWHRAGPLVAGSVLIIAGLYQVSPLKNACLAGCRSPLAFFAYYWRGGWLNAVAMGIRHGIVCVGCCWAMMAVMFVVGAMSLAWMALLTLIMFAEKVFPKGQRLIIPIACFFWIMGGWIVVSPETAPLFKNPMMFGAVIGHGH